MSESDTKQLLQRLRELEEENAKLKTNNAQLAANAVVVTEGGTPESPRLTFQKGRNRPFTLGFRKLAAIREVWSQVEAFLNKHENQLPSQGIPDLHASPNDDDRI